MKISLIEVAKTIVSHASFCNVFVFFFFICTLAGPRSHCAWFTTTSVDAVNQCTARFLVTDKFSQILLLWNAPIKTAPHFSSSFKHVESDTVSFSWEYVHWYQLTHIYKNPTEYLHAKKISVPKPIASHLNRQHCRGVSGLMAS